VEFLGKARPKKCKNIGANSYRKYGKIVDDIFAANIGFIKGT
jgi:hypothetical protein